LVLFRQIRELAEALQRLAFAIERHNRLAPSDARLEDLERSRALWEADMKGLLVKAESTLSGARNAESRARTMLKHYEKDADPFPADREETEPAHEMRVPDFDAEAGTEEGMHVLHMGVEVDHKAAALNAKFA